MANSSDRAGPAVTKYGNDVVTRSKVAVNEPSAAGVIRTLPASSPLPYFSSGTSPASRPRTRAVTVSGVPARTFEVPGVTSISSRAGST